MQIDRLEQVKSVDDLLKVDESLLYDESPEYGENGLGHPNINPCLTEEEVEDALFWLRFHRGIMLVVGSAGAGKGLFANMLAWKMRYYFGKKVLLDYRPRKLFDEIANPEEYRKYQPSDLQTYYRHIPFNEKILVDQLRRMSKVAAVGVRDGVVQSNGGKKESPLLDNLAQEWTSRIGQVFLRNSVMVLDEFKRYFYKREPHNPMGRTLGKVFDIWRHLGILIIGIAIDERELDRFNCIPKITSIVRCTWLNPYTIKKHNLAPYSTMVDITPVKYVGVAGEGVLDMASPTIRRIVEGGRPRECLGGKRWVDIYNSEDAKDIAVPAGLGKAARD